LGRDAAVRLRFDPASTATLAILNSDGKKSTSSTFQSSYQWLIRIIGFAAADLQVFPVFLSGHR
jgi:hypothetical protein